MKQTKLSHKNIKQKPCRQNDLFRGLLKSSSVMLKPFVVFGCLSSTMVLQSAPHLIRDTQSATRWDNGYPVGNGSLGALNYGSFPTERVLINDETIWVHKTKVELKPDSAAVMRKVHGLVDNGNYAEADKIYVNELMPGIRPNTYQLLGFLHLTHEGSATDVQQLERSLKSRRRSFHHNDPKLDNGTITQEIVASHASQCIAIRLTSTCPDGLRFKLG